MRLVFLAVLPGSFALLLLMMVACNSGSGTDCSGASCAAIADEIHEAGGGAGACVDPEPKLETLCQELAH